MPEFGYIARDHAGQKRRPARSPAASRARGAGGAGRAGRCFRWRSSDATPSADSRTRAPRAGAAAGRRPTANWPTCCAAACRCCGRWRCSQKQTSHAGLKRVLDEVHHQVEDGATLADAMGRFQRVFGEMAVSMVRAGGEGGFLEEALARVAEFTEAQDDLKKRTVGAVAYPAFLAVVGTIVVDRADRLLRAEVRRPVRPAARARRTAVPDRRGCCATSDVLRQWGLLVLAALVVGGWLLRAVAADRAPAAGRRDRVKLRLPLAGADLPRPGRGPLLPRAGHAAAQRRADPPLAGNLQRRHGQPRAGRRHPRGHREHLGRPAAGRAAGRQRAVSRRRWSR